MGERGACSKKSVLIYQKGANDQVLDKSGFDDWAGSYEGDVLREKEKGYPFAGYAQTLSLIQQTILDSGAGRRILDIGVGTGLLSEILYQNGYEITGVDFSEKMLEIARGKMPGARFIRADLGGDSSKINLECCFDFIISTYALHHFPDDQKVRLISGLTERLAPDGMFLIGDIAFQSAAHREDVRASSSGWDENEYYFAADDFLAHLAALPLQAEFVQTSICSGVLKLVKNRAIR